MISYISFFLLLNSIYPLLIIKMNRRWEKFENIELMLAYEISLEHFHREPICLKIN